MSRTDKILAFQTTKFEALFSLSRSLTSFTTISLLLYFLEVLGVTPSERRFPSWKPFCQCQDAPTLILSVVAPLIRISWLETLSSKSLLLGLALLAIVLTHYPTSSTLQHTHSLLNPSKLKVRAPRLCAISATAIQLPRPTTSALLAYA